MDTLSRKQLSMVAEVTVGYRPKIRPSQRPTVTCASDAYEVLSKFWNEDQIEMRETFFVMLLNANGRVMGIVELSNGGFRGVVVEIKMIFAIALKACASSIVLAHNHPSGNLKPSAQDVMVTKKLKVAGEILELPVYDHLVVTSEGFTSLAEEGYI